MTLSTERPDGPVDESTGLLTSKHVDQRDNYGSSSSDVESGTAEETILSEERTYSNSFIAKVVIALLIGVFTSNADGSLVLATHPVIASEFDNLGDSSWLFISFMLAGATTQALYGKISDIFGRRSILVLCYFLFAIGCGLVGIGQSMWCVLLGRVISGSGGAGMTVLASVIITDLAPLRDVASWQAYMNVIATVGRSLGGPLGGWLADTIGWRWSFLGQAPIFFAAIPLCWCLLPSSSSDHNGHKGPSYIDRFKRIDGLGAVLLGSGILSLMLPLEVGGQKIPWTHPLIFVLFGIGTLCIALFILAESRWAVEPILLLRLFQRKNVTLSFIIMTFQSAAQLGMMFNVPLYFQVTQNASSTVAGAHLFPAVIGNTIGGILSGLIIKRTGRYKNLLILAALFSISCYTLMLLRWNGKTGLAESLYVFPGGLGTGMSQSAVFIALQASILPQDKAPAASALFLCFPVGAIIGMVGSSAIMLAITKRVVRERLSESGMSSHAISDILRRATESVGYIEHAPHRISAVLVEGYIKGIEYSHGLSIGFSVVALLAGILLRERRI